MGVGAGVSVVVQAWVRVWVWVVVWTRVRVLGAGATTLTSVSKPLMAAVSSEFSACTQKGAQHKRMMPTQAKLSGQAPGGYVDRGSAREAGACCAGGCD